VHQVQVPCDLGLSAVLTRLLMSPLLQKPLQQVWDQVICVKVVLACELQIWR
jgi:hypothetical protein